MSLKPVKSQKFNNRKKNSKNNPVYFNLLKIKQRLTVVIHSIVAGIAGVTYFSGCM